MVRMTKVTGETLLVAPPEIIAVERQGSVTRVRTRGGVEYLVVEMPEDILAQIDAWRRGVERETPPEFAAG